MTDNNVSKYIAKQPFIPKTETRIFLGGRPIDQQTEQTGSKGISKQHYQSIRATINNPGYGPMPANSSNSFTLTISMRGDSYNQYAFKTSGATFSTCTLGSVDEAVMWVVKLGSGEVKVVDTKNDNKRNTNLEEKIKEDIHQKLAEFMIADLKEGEGLSYGLIYSSNTYV